ncbi:MAG: type II secretion system F family protein, partial [Dechloromonas sp.]
MEFDVTAIFPGQGVCRLRVAATSAEALAAAPALRDGIVVSARAIGGGRRRRADFPLPLF